jgi:hypothetical protein
MDRSETFDITELREALQYLVDNELEGKAKGITCRVLTHGVFDLSPKQRFIFKTQVADEWLTRTCGCGNHSVEDDELIGLWVNHGYCARCADRNGKDAREAGISDW